MWKRLFIMGETNLAMVDTHTRMTVMKARITLMHFPRRTLAFTVSVCRACCSCWCSSSLEMRVWQDSRASCGQEGEQGQTLVGSGAAGERMHEQAPRPQLRKLKAKAEANSQADSEDDDGDEDGGKEVKREPPGSFTLLFLAERACVHNHKIPHMGALQLSILSLFVSEIKCVKY